MNVVLVVEHLRQLAEGHAVADGDGAVVGEALAAGLGERALNVSSGQRIGTVEDDDCDSCFGCGFEEVSQRGFVGVEADAGILQINHYRVELLENVLRRAAGFVGGTVHAVHGDAGGGVAGVADLRSVEGAGYTMLGAEDGGELNSGGMGENVDGAAA